jgi:microcystin-dependent protein
MSEPFLGEIRIFGFNFAPQGWAMCNGDILAISQNQALFALLGTTYGGNGTSTFALPDLRSRVPLHFGQGSGLSNYSLGEVTGTETVTLTTQQLPQHNHAVNASGNPGDQRSPIGNVPAAEATAQTAMYSTTATGQMASNTVGSAGGSQPFSIVQPVLALNLCIALVGIFPPRN